MGTKSKITITSKQIPEFNTNITIDSVTYHVQTEDMGLKSRKVSSKVYLKGEVLFSRTLDYAHIVKLDDFSQRLADLMSTFHKSTIGLFRTELAAKQKQKSEYLNEVKDLLKRGQAEAALASLRTALERYPGDPFFLSYMGCLVAVVEDRPMEGIRICREAIDRLEKSLPFGREFFYPIFYLNLGRAYLKNDNRKEAVSTFNKGLRHSPDNHEILDEMAKLGIRRNPPLSFLKRSNPINRYIGKLLHSPKK